RLVDTLAGYAAQTGVQVTVVFDAGGRQRGGPTLEVIDGVTVRFGTKASSADHIIEREAFAAKKRGAVIDLVVATNDRLQRDVVGAMGVPTMGAKALDEEVRRAVTAFEQQTRTRREHPAHQGRLEHHIAPDVAARLEKIRRGEE